MDVSIIIVNYKTVPLILNCIESVYARTEGICYEIIVVDNNSQDGFAEKIQSRFPKVICLPLSENIGFGRANNEGIKIAKGRNIFFLNPDTLLLNNAIKILSDYLDTHPKTGACGGNLYDEDIKPTHSYCMMLPGIRWELNGLFHGLIDKVQYGKNAQFNHTGKPRKVGYITGADLMIPRCVLEKVGVFSPEFFMYYEETELSFRIRQKGYGILSIPGAEIQHLEGKSMGGKKVNLNRILMYDTSYSTYLRLCSGAFERKLVRAIRLFRLYLKQVFTDSCSKEYFHHRSIEIKK